MTVRNPIYRKVLLLNHRYQNEGKNNGAKRKNITLQIAAVDVIERNPPELLIELNNGIDGVSCSRQNSGLEARNPKQKPYKHDEQNSLYGRGPGR